MRNVPVGAAGSRFVGTAYTEVTMESATVKGIEYFMVESRWYAETTGGRSTTVECWK